MKLHAEKRSAALKRAGLDVVCGAVLALCCGSAGCHRAPAVSQEEQVRAALNAFYAAQPACLWASPVSLKPVRGKGETMSAKEARALDDAGLIDRERHGATLTNAGAPFWRESRTEPGLGNLCFGKWQVDHVDHVTLRKDDLTGSMADTTFQASMRAPALWTRLPAVRAAFPDMAARLDGQAQHSATMRHTGQGWQVAVIATP